MIEEKDKFDKLEEAFKEVLGNTENLLQDIRDKHPELKERFDAIDSMFEEIINKPNTDKKEKKIFCECLGDIRYEEALKLRFPFKSTYYKDIELIEKSAGIIIDRNKGYCHSAMYNMVWLDNGEPAIIMRALKIGEGAYVADIHQPDHPEWFPTPEDINEFPEEELKGE